MARVEAAVEATLGARARVGSASGRTICTGGGRGSTKGGASGSSEGGRVYLGFGMGAEIVGRFGYVRVHARRTSCETE